MLQGGCVVLRNHSVITSIRTVALVPNSDLVYGSSSKFPGGGVTPTFLRAAESTSGRKSRTARRVRHAVRPLSLERILRLPVFRKALYF